MGDSLSDDVKGLLEDTGGRKTVSMDGGNRTETGAGCLCHWC